MQTITITIDNGVRVVDATTTELTRTVGMVWSISIVDTAGAAITHASVDRWELIVAQDFRAATAVLASGTIYNPETGALVIAINGQHHPDGYVAGWQTRPSRQSDVGGL